MQDPYARCMCGSGKGIKWCCQKAVAQLNRIAEWLEREEPAKALELLDKGDLPVATPGYTECIRAQVLLSLGRAKEAYELLEKTAEKHPNYAMPHELLAELKIVAPQAPDAVDEMMLAYNLYPPDAVEHRVAALVKLGDMQTMRYRPIAAWAAWQRAHKLQPGAANANQRLERFRADPILPQVVKHGGMLKSPDELNVFNEERRKRWDECLAKETDWQLDDLAEAFEFLANDDRYDAAACFNLGIVNAWLGRNEQAVAALERYVEMETDAESAANAWDMAELLRCGLGCESIADELECTMAFRVTDAAGFQRKFTESRRIAVASTDPEMPEIYWLNQKLEPPQSPNLLTKPLRRLGRIVPRGEDALIALCPSEADADEFRESFLAEFGSVMEMGATRVSAAHPSSIDGEPLTYVPREKLDEKGQIEFFTEKARQYFEEKWIHKKLKSLGGVPPVDATQRPAGRAKLEGVLRFRERLYGHSLARYDFGRLRNLLGLEVKRTAEDEPKVRDISALPVSELVKLAPAELSDDELTVAYRTANALDAPRTAVQFGEEIIRRDSLAGKLDLAAVFKRIIVDRLEHGYKAGLAEMLERAIAFDKKHYGGEHLADFRMLQGRVRLLEGDSDAACKLFQELADKETSNLGLLASVVEKLLSAGVYKRAHEFAKLGLERAQSARQKDYQEQFRDYVAASARRL